MKHFISFLYYIEQFIFDSISKDFFILVGAILGLAAILFGVVFLIPTLPIALRILIMFEVYGTMLYYVIKETMILPFIKFIKTAWIESNPNKEISKGG